MMRQSQRNTVGGYQGQVSVLTPEGVEVARAGCRYRAEADARNEDHWRGQLHRIVPADAVAEGSYRLQFPSGEQGDIIIESVSIDRSTLFFAGIGARPLFPLDPPRRSTPLPPSATERTG
jgi:hypothetical protein